MFPFHQGSEPVCQICSNPYQQQKIPQDLILDPASLDDNNYNNTVRKGQRRNLWDVFDKNHCNVNDNKKQKMRHRDVERQRRQEMAKLHLSLRSSLPLEIIKGKRSISDHVNEAVNYIKRLETKIKELSSVKDEMKKYSDSSATDYRSGCLDSSPPSCFQVNPFCGGVEILITTGFKEKGLPLSRILEVLLEGGLTIVSCVSTRVNDRILYTIQSEVSDATCLDQSGLQKKLTEAFPSLRCTSL